MKSEYYENIELNRDKVMKIWTLSSRENFVGKREELAVAAVSLSSLGNYAGRV